MAHWINKKYKTKISDRDYDIISTGRKFSFGKKNGNGFGVSPKDYIEMNIFNLNGVLLESIKIRDIDQYVDTSGKIKINPGVLMRRNGYFSGDYEIEVNFLREVAGSSESVLVNQNNEIYTGEYDVLIDGSVVERTTGKPLREIDYKYYVHQISNSKKEIRLATLPIKNEQYKKQFTSLSEQKVVTYANTTEDVVNFDNPNSNQSNQFTLGVNNSIQLDKGMIGGDFVINDAFEIMDLTNLNRDNDGFQITIGGKGANRHYGPGDGYINRGDQDPSNNISKNDTFRKIAADTDSGGDSTLVELAKNAKQDSGLLLFDGAFIMGYKTAGVHGFPYQINTTISDLNKIDFLQPELSVKLRGVDLVSGNVFESESKQKYNGSGTKGTLPIPTNHRLQGALYSAEFNLSYDLNGIRRGFTIFRPNLFAVIPTYKDKEAGESVRPGQEFVIQGINF